jgi:hypothetical protein
MFDVFQGTLQSNVARGAPGNVVIQEPRIMPNGDDRLRDAPTCVSVIIYAGVQRIKISSIGGRNGSTSCLFAGRSMRGECENAGAADATAAQIVGDGCWHGFCDFTDASAEKPTVTKGAD